jgi:hypothetical protein
MMVAIIDQRPPLTGNCGEVPDCPLLADTDISQIVAATERTAGLMIYFERIAIFQLESGARNRIPSRTERWQCVKRDFLLGFPHTSARIPG